MGHSLKGRAPVPIYYPDILENPPTTWTFTYGDKDVMLYALGVGLGQDPMNETELAFVYEKGLKVVPTAATVLAGRGASEPLPTKPGHRPSQPNYLMLVHGEQKVELHRPLPEFGTFTAEMRVVGAFDKGAGKGAVVVNETVWMRDGRLSRRTPNVGSCTTGLAPTPSAPIAITAAADQITYSDHKK